MKILIKVTKEVLERSKFCSISIAPTNCAFALALRDLFPFAAVFSNTAYLLGSFDQFSPDNVYLPRNAQKFIQMFDTCQPEDRVNIQPFSFEIEVPEFVIQAIGVSEIYRVLSESKTLEHVNA